MAGLSVPRPRATLDGVAKLRIYIDSSVFGGLLDTTLPQRLAATQAFLERVGEFDACVSAAVVEELSAHGDAGKRECLLSACRSLARIPSEGTEIDALVAEYLRWGALPASAQADARHVAAASVARLDTIVSWNFKHLVRLRTRRLVQAVNAAVGLAGVDIVSPEEL